MLSIFGGKITTFRKLAEHALDELKTYLPDHEACMDGRLRRCRAATCRMRISTASSPPCASAGRSCPNSVAHRLARAYGTRIEELLGSAKALADLGEDFGAGLTAAEVDYLVRREWARSAEDILWRRSKLGLHVPVDAAARIDAYLAKKNAASVAAQ